MLRLTFDASTDVQAAYDWYERQQPGLGAGFIAQLDALFSRIGGQALIYPIHYRGLRRALVRQFPYAVYFERDDLGDVLVIAVLHQRQDRAALHERSRD